MRNKLFFFISMLLLITTNNIQTQDVTDALARMERAINSSEEEFTLRDSYYLGRAVAAQILSRYSLYNERPDLINYLNLICYALAINSHSPNWFNGYYVMLLDDHAFNAFSTPGGHIFISRGLIELTSSEDMLAAIIAHEMAHIQLQHGIANIMHHRLIENLGQERTRIIQNSRIETQHQTFAEFVNKIIETLLIGGFSQLQEFEADSFAFTLLRITGYDAVSLIELLGMLERQNQNKIGNLNTSHPLPAQRIANLERQIPVHRMTRNNFVRMDRFNRIMGRNLQ